MPGIDARQRRGVGPEHVGQYVREILRQVRPIRHLAGRTKHRWGNDRGAGGAADHPQQGIPADDAEPPDDPIATPREIGERPGIMTMDIRRGSITGWAAGCRLCGSDIVYPRDEEGNRLTKSGQEPEKNRRESTRTLKPEMHNPFWCDVHSFCHSERLPDRHPTVRARAEPISSYNPDPTTRLWTRGEGALTRF
jgi:hypothetical protein